MDENFRYTALQVHAEKWGFLAPSPGQHSIVNHFTGFSSSFFISLSKWLTLLFPKLSTPYSLLIFFFFAVINEDLGKFLLLTS